MFNCLSNFLSPLKRKTEVNRIYHKYIQHGAVEETYCSGAIRESIVNKLEDNNINGIFDEVEESLLIAIQQNIWYDFKNSEEFKSLHSLLVMQKLKIQSFLIKDREIISSFFNDIDRSFCDVKNDKSLKLLLGSKKQFQLWNISSGKCIFETELEIGYFNNLKLCQHSNVVCSTSTNQIILWPLHNEEAKTPIYIKSTGVVTAFTVHKRSFTYANDLGYITNYEVDLKLEYYYNIINSNETKEHILFLSVSRDHIFALTPKYLLVFHNTLRQGDPVFKKQINGYPIAMFIFKQKKNFQVQIFTLTNEKSTCNFIQFVVKPKKEPTKLKRISISDDFRVLYSLNLSTPTNDNQIKRKKSIS